MKRNFLLLFLFSSLILNFIFAGIEQQAIHNVTHHSAIEDEIIETKKVAYDQQKNVLEDEPLEEDVFIDEKKEKELSQPTKPQLELLDRIEAIVAVGELTDIITTIDIDRRGFDGHQYTVEDLVSEDLLDQLGAKFKVVVEDKDVTRYLQKMKMPEAQIKAIAQAWGYPSVQDFYTVFKKMYRATTSLNYQVQSELVFTEEVIKEYYEAHPILREAFYIVETAFVPLAQEEDRELLYEELKAYAQGKKKIPSIIWDAPAQIAKSDVPQANEFIFSMHEDEIFVKPVSGGFNLFKMNKISAECAAPLQERREEILTTLRNEKYEEAVNKVLNRLRTDAFILYPSEKQYPIDIANFI